MGLRNWLRKRRERKAEQQRLEEIFRALDRQAMNTLARAAIHGVTDEPKTDGPLWGHQGGGGCHTN